MSISINILLIFNTWNLVVKLVIINMYKKSYQILMENIVHIEYLHFFSTTEYLLKFVLYFIVHRSLFLWSKPTKQSDQTLPNVVFIEQLHGLFSIKSNSKHNFRQFTWVYLWFNDWIYLMIVLLNLKSEITL